MDLTLHETAKLIQDLDGVFKHQPDHELRAGLRKLAGAGVALADDLLAAGPDDEVTRIRAALAAIESAAGTARTQELAVARGELDRALGKLN